MAKSSRAKFFSQKKKEIFAWIKMNRRRIEYFVFVIPSIFILLGYTANAIRTNDWTHFHMFFTLAYRVIGYVTTNIVPITAIFAVVSLSIATLVRPKVVQVIGTIVVLASFILIFLVPAEVTREWLVIAREYVLANAEVFTAIGIIIFLIIIWFKKTRKWLFHTIKYSFEIAVFSVIFYFAGLLKTLNFAQLAKDYWNTFVHGVRYLNGFADISVLVYLGIVFSIIYASTFRATIFHIKRHRQIKDEFKIVLSDKEVQKNVELVKEGNRKKYILLKDEHLPKIGICVPAYNEELTAPKTLDSILSCDYPANKCEILLVADGSTDGTVEAVIKRYDMKKLPNYATKPVFKLINHKPIKEVWQSRLYPNLRMVVKENGGKHDALNTGLQYFSRDVEYFSVIDADTTLCKHAFRLLATEALKSKGVVALAGTILPRDEYKWHQPMRAAFTNWQYFDYLCSFHISRASLSMLNAMMTVSGAYGFFDRYMVLAIEGYKKTLAEDTFLTLELHGDPKSVIKYIPEAVAYTQVPTTFGVARKQRMRWFKGLTEVLSAFRKMWVENPKMVAAFAEFFFVEWITPLLAPFGVAIVLAKPEMLLNPLFQFSMGLAIITPMIQGIIGMCIEASYRKVKWWKLFYLPVQIFMAPLMIIWRNDAIMDYSSKAWGKMIRS